MKSIKRTWKGSLPDSLSDLISSDGDGYLPGQHEFCPKCDEDLLTRKRHELKAA